MIPALNGIDHAHVYVKNLKEARQWYCDIMGFIPIDKQIRENKNDGPLMLKDRSDIVHLALFESTQTPSSILAFGTTGGDFLRWITHMASKNIETRLADHATSWSLYFIDSFGNQHEITTKDYVYTQRQLVKS